MPALTPPAAAKWRGRFAAAAYLAVAIVSIPFLIVWVIAGAQEKRR